MKTTTPTDPSKTRRHSLRRRHPQNLPFTATVTPCANIASSPTALPPLLLLLLLLAALAPPAIGFSQPHKPAGTAPSSPSDGDGEGEEGVRVWDDVVPPNLRSALHASASAAGLGHRAFARPLRPDVEYGTIERALDSILTQMEEMEKEEGGELDDDGDNLTAADDDGKRTYVEYWTRQEWRSIEAHADVDEFRAKEDDKASAEAAEAAETSAAADGGGPGGYRYPQYGHVLYLEVGREVRGPTCVFPGRRSGGDLLRPAAAEVRDRRRRRVRGQMKQEDDEASSSSSCTATAADDGGADADAADVELITVPAVPGRLLRFPGSALHAVPRPADLWLLPFVRGASVHEPEELWGRSVVLFNVWTDGDDDGDDGGGGPPEGVPLDIGGGDSEAAGSEEEEEEERDADTVNVAACNPRSEWVDVRINELDTAASAVPGAMIDEGEDNDNSNGILGGRSSATTDEKKVSAKVWLLGNLRRRDHPMRTVKLMAPEIALASALGEERAVSRVWMERPASPLHAYDIA